MKLEFFPVVFAIAAIVICLSNGAPPWRENVKCARGRKYTSQEEDLIIKELVSRASTYDSTRTWGKIADIVNQKVLDNADGFPIPRTANGLKLHFPKIIKKGIMVPPILRKLYDEQFVRKFFTPQERQLINTELLSCDVLYRDDTWARILKKHDHLRESGCLGFENPRKAETLRTHFTHVMVPKGYVDKRLKEKFPQHLISEDGKCTLENVGVEQADTGRSENEELACGEQDDFWDILLTDLSDLQRNPVDDYGVDCTVFVDPWEGRDNNIFEEHWPHEPRKFYPSLAVTP